MALIISQRRYLMSIQFYGAKGAFGVLSNFFVHEPPLVIDGQPVKTVEHWFQAAKFSYPGASEASLAYAEKISNAKSAAVAKVLARQKPTGGQPWRTALNAPITEALAAGVRLRADWDRVKEDVMLQALRAKFHQDARCKELLLSTGDKRLVEHTPRDKYWADGGGNGRGRNRLGALLEMVRAELKGESVDVGEDANPSGSLVALLTKKRKLQEASPDTTESEAGVSTKRPHTTSKQGTNKKQDTEVIDLT